MTQTAHTPTPYVLQEFDDGLGIAREIDGDLETIAILENTIDGKRKENAAFIVKACNAHGELVKALEKIADYSLGSTVQPALIARAILAKAQSS